MVEGPTAVRVHGANTGRGNDTGTRRDPRPKRPARWGPRRKGGACTSREARPYAAVKHRSGMDAASLGEELKAIPYTPGAVLRRPS